jgi:hypothetical protein
VAVVELVGGTIGIPALGKDKDVGRATDWVGEDGDGLEVDIRVVARSLAGRGTVEVPHGKLIGLVGLLWEGLFMNSCQLELLSTIVAMQRLIAIHHRP